MLHVCRRVDFPENLPPWTTMRRSGPESRVKSRERRGAETSPSDPGKGPICSRHSMSQAAPQPHRGHHRVYRLEAGYVRSELECAAGRSGPGRSRATGYSPPGRPTTGGQIGAAILDRERSRGLLRGLFRNSARLGEGQQAGCHASRPCRGDRPHRRWRAHHAPDGPRGDLAGPLKATHAGARPTQFRTLELGRRAPEQPAVIRSGYRFFPVTAV